MRREKIKGQDKTRTFRTNRPETNTPLQDLTRDEFIELMQKFGYDNTDDSIGDYFDDTEDGEGFEAFNDDEQKLLIDYKLWLSLLDWARS